MTAEAPHAVETPSLRPNGSGDLAACLIYVGRILDRPITAAAIDAQRSGLDAGFGPREALDLAAR